jgi:uncharacterized membrane protein
LLGRTWAPRCPKVLALDAAAGVIAGIAHTAGRYTMLVEATDRLGGISERNLVLAVRPAPKT